LQNFRQDVLDLIFSNCLIYSIRVGISLTPQFDTYHPPLEFIFNPESPETTVESPTPIIYNLNACNFDDLNKFLSQLDFKLNFKNLSLECDVNKFYEIIFHSCDIHVGTEN